MFHIVLFCSVCALVQHCPHCNEKITNEQPCYLARHSAGVHRKLHCHADGALLSRAASIVWASLRAGWLCCVISRSYPNPISCDTGLFFLETFLAAHKCETQGGWWKFAVIRESHFCEETQLHELLLDVAFPRLFF